jgi:hypothetical protein
MPYQSSFNGMDLNKLQNCFFLKTNNRFFALARTWPTDTRQLPTISHVVNRGKAAFENLPDVLSVQQGLEAYYVRSFINHDFI